MSSPAQAPAPASERAGYAVDVLRRLYPPPLQVGAASTAAAPVRARFLLLPTPGRPRLVVPAGHRRAAGRAVHRQLTGRRPRTRAARLLLRAAVASGLADRLPPGPLLVSGPSGADCVDRVLAGVLGRQGLLVSLPLSPPRANRKPVLQVCDRAGRALAFVKVGHDPLTRRLVAAEGDSLEQLASAGLRGVRVPAVLARLAWNELDLLVLEPLPLSRRRLGGPVARTALLAAVREIAALGASPATGWADSPYRPALAGQLADCGAAAASLLGHLQALDATAPQLALGAWHGDLNPGNVALVEEQSLVWDWERFEHGVPLGFDLLHHDLHRDVTMAQVPPPEAARRLLAAAAATLAPLAVGPAEAEATARLYLLALAARYLRDRQSEAGGGLGSVETWLLPALDAARRPAR